MVLLWAHAVTGGATDGAANVGPWAALNGAGTHADLARLPPVINEQVGFTRNIQG